MKVLLDEVTVTPHKAEAKIENVEKKEDGSIMAVRNIAGAVDHVDDQSLEDGPVTLVFLGYTDSTTDQGQGQEELEGMLTAERVIITEEGEEHVIGPETSGLHNSSLPSIAEGGGTSKRKTCQCCSVM
uniref:Uncharacterized protein n=1 Tax=Sparus aurata TaxID=8175 RepID=A0A671XY04_SPAAU